MDDGLCSFYGFAQPPFLPVTEPAKIFHAGSRTGVVGEILAEILDGNEIVMIRGDRGSGKTSLLPVLAAALSARDVLVVQVSGDSQTPENVERLMRRAGGLAADMLEPGQLDRRLTGGRAAQVALLFDDADTLPDSMFGFLQRLLELSRLTGTSLSLVLVGGRGVWAGLMHPDLEEMGLAGMTAHLLTRLSPVEAAAYLDHRLSSAGQPISQVMTPNAVTELIGHSTCVPGQLNELTERALDLGYRRGTRRITSKLLLQSLSGESPPGERMRWSSVALMAACVGVVAIAGTALVVRLRPGERGSGVSVAQNVPLPAPAIRPADKKAPPAPQPAVHVAQAPAIEASVPPPQTAPDVAAPVPQAAPRPSQLPVVAQKPPSPPEQVAVAAPAHEAASRPKPPPAVAEKPPAPPEKVAKVTASPPPREPAGAAGGAPGLVLIAGPGDDMPTLYARVYKGLTKPPYEAVVAVNKMPVKPGAIVVFPEPPDGWSPRPGGT